MTFCRLQNQLSERSCLWDWFCSSGLFGFLTATEQN